MSWGRELLDGGEPLEERRKSPLLDNILSVNPALMGFGLARPDGTLVRIGTNMDTSRLPNLLGDYSTAEGFEQALESDVMVVGRTYYMDALGAWLIPIRKALRADDGSVVADKQAGRLKIGAVRLRAGSARWSRTVSSCFGRQTNTSSLYPRGATPERYSASQVNEERLSARQRDFEGGNRKDHGRYHGQSGGAVFFSYDPRPADVRRPYLRRCRYRIWTVSETRLPLFTAILWVPSYLRD